MVKVQRKKVKGKEKKEKEWLLTSFGTDIDKKKYIQFLFKINNSLHFFCKPIWGFQVEPVRSFPSNNRISNN